MARTEQADRTATMEEAFAQAAPETNLPAAIQQVIMDERPQGAIKVAKERDLQKVLRDIKAVATAAGDDFFYSWPTNNKDGTKGVVEGPSVKCANAVARIFGNCQVRIRAFDQGPHWILYAQFYDMESGFVYERPFQQRKAQNIGGKMDKDRATDIVFQIGCSKAARNVVCNALSEFTDYAFDVAKDQLVERIGKQIEKFRARVIERLAELKVDLKRVETVRGKVIKDWLAPDVAKTIAEIQAVNDGMGHPDEIWPHPEAGQARPSMDDFIDDRTPEQKAADKAAGFPDPQNDADMKLLVEGRAKYAAELAARAGKDAKAAEAAAKAAPVAAQGTDPDPKPAEAPAAEDPKPGTGGPAAAEQAQGEGDDEAKRQERFETAEGMLVRAKDNLSAINGGDEKQMAEYDEAIKTSIREFDLDDEDKAVLLGRWNTTVLEHKRAAGRKSSARKPR
jgi:hypothetical protein